MDTNAQIGKDRRKHFENIYRKHHENNDVSATYRTAKTQVGWKTTTSPVNFLVNGRVVTAPQEIAEIQAKTFQDKTKQTN